MNHAISKTASFSVPLAIASFLLLVGFIVRVQHWANGAIIERVAYIAIGVLYIGRFAAKSNKSLTESIQVVLIVAWSAGSVLAPVKMPYIFILQVFIAVLGGCWLVLEIAELVNKKSPASHKILVLGAFILAGHGFLRVNQMPFGALFHPTALLLFTFGFILDAILTKKN